MKSMATIKISSDLVKAFAPNLSREEISQILEIVENKAYDCLGIHSFIQEVVNEYEYNTTK